MRDLDTAKQKVIKKLEKERGLYDLKERECGFGYTFFKFDLPSYMHPFVSDDAHSVEIYWDRFNGPKGAYGLRELYDE